MKATNVIARVLPAVALAASLGNLDQAKAWSGCAYMCVTEGCLGFQGNSPWACTTDYGGCEIDPSLWCLFFS
jgi:hypothetical protein